MAILLVPDKPSIIDARERPEEFRADTCGPFRVGDDLWGVVVLCSEALAPHAPFSRIGDGRERGTHLDGTPDPSPALLERGPGRRQARGHDGRQHRVHLLKHRWRDPM